MRNQNDYLNFQRLILDEIDKIDKSKVSCRKAFLAGVNVALVMSILYAEADFPELTPEFWKVIYPTIRDVPDELILFITKISRSTGGSVNLLTENFQEPGLRYGVPGTYYTKGIALGVEAGMIAVPSILGKKYKNKYQKTMEWIERQSQWLGGFEV